MSPLSHLIATNLNLTADASPVGHASEYGNGPFTAASTVTGLAPGITSTPSSAQGNFVISSTAVGAANANPYMVMVNVTDNPIMVSSQSQQVVPARTVTKTYTHMVHPPLQLAQSLGRSWPDGVNGRAYGTGTGCTGGACASAVYTATNGLGGYVWPGSMPASISAITGMSCPAVATGSATYTCSATSVTAAPAAAGAASVTYKPSVTVTDTGNTATPPATATSDPLSARTDTLNVDAPLLATLTQNREHEPRQLDSGSRRKELWSDWRSSYVHGDGRPGGWRYGRGSV